jgi:hypothetical protein
MQPINYMLDVQQPLQMALAGYTQGQGIRANQQGMEDQRRLMEMQEMQFQQQQQAIQQQQARAQEMQMDMAGIADDVASGQFSPARLFEMQAKYPEVGEYLSGLYTNVSEQQKEGMIDERVRFINLVRNNPELARTKLEERRDAYLNSGQTDEAKAIDAELAQMETAPEAVMLAHMFEVNALMNDPERFESLAGMIMPPAPELPAAVQTFEALAQRAGLQPGTPEYARAAEEAMSGGGVEINMPGSAEEGAFEKKVGELQATSIGAIADMGITARRNRQTLNQLDTALAESAGGFEAGFKSALGDFGIATQGLTEIQAAEALISQLVPAQRPPGSGTMSDRDLDLFKKSLPRLIQTPEGRRKIIENMKAINQYMIAEGDLADAVLDGTITRAQYREQMRALGNPLAGTAASGTGAAPAPKTGIEVAPRLQKYFGD